VFFLTGAIEDLRVGFPGAPSEGGPHMNGTDRYRVRGVSCRLGDHRVDIVNISVGGMFVACDAPLTKGQGVSLELSLPHRALSIVGQVSWTNERNMPKVKDLPPGFGVKIVRMDFVDKMALLGFLREVDPSALRRV